jgi:hypothetical protein
VKYLQLQSSNSQARGFWNYRPNLAGVIFLRFRRAEVVYATTISNWLTTTVKNSQLRQTAFFLESVAA